MQSQNTFTLMNSNYHTEHPEQWALAIDIDTSALSYLLYSITGNEEPRVGTVKIQDTGDWCKALENAVYDNTFLLDDYHHATIALHSQHFALMPQEVAHAGLATPVLEASFSSVEGEVLTSEVNGTGAAIACDVPRGVLGFLNRTFNSPTLLHHLAPLCRYCCNAYAEDNGCLHVMVEKDVAHLVATVNGKLHLANTIHYRSHDDLVYFTLNAWQSSNMNNAYDNLLISGDNEVRQQLAQSMRQWVKYAMPEAIPVQALKLSRNAIAIPFNLILLALYENN